jgi:ribosomal protein S25
MALIIGLIVLGTSGLTQADGPADAGGSTLFADVPAGHWALASLQFLAERGVIEGLPNGQFQGDRAPSRYEVAVMLARALQYLEGQVPQGPVSAQRTATEQLRPEDIKVLQDLIFKISDRLQQLSGEVNALKSQRPEIDPDLAERIQTLETQREEIDQLRAQIEQDQQAIRDLKDKMTKFQSQATTVSEETVAKTNQQVLANRLIGLFALGAAIVGVALATLR